MIIHHTTQKILLFLMYIQLITSKLFWKLESKLLQLQSLRSGKWEHNMLHLWPLHQANKDPSELNAITLHLGELSLKIEESYHYHI